LTSLACCLALAGLALGAAPGGDGAGAPPAALSLDRLKAGMTEAQGRLESVRVVYRIPYDPRRYPGFPPSTFLRVELATRGHDRGFLDRAHMHAHLPWRDDPARNRNYISPGRYVIDWPYDLTYEDRPCPVGSELPLRFRGELFFLATGWWPPGFLWPAPRFDDRPFMLHEVAKSADYRLRPRLELRDGRWAHVLELGRGLDVLWIDADRGCALLARECRDETTGLVVQQFSAGGHREVADGVWFPGWFENQQFEVGEAAAPDETRRRTVSRATVDEVQINGAVADDLFRYEPRPGALWFDRENGGCEQRVPGGLGHLDDLARSVALAPGRPGPRARPSAWLIVAISSFTSSSLLALGRRLAKRRRLR
jgi:hypothetical protein